MSVIKGKMFVPAFFIFCIYHVTSAIIPLISILWIMIMDKIQFLEKLVLSLDVGDSYEAIETL